MKIIYELVLPGFDAADDGTDHLVLWVAAENKAATKVRLLLAADLLGCNITLTTLPEDCPDIDLVFDPLNVGRLEAEVHARLHGGRYLTEHGIKAPKEDGSVEAYPAEDGRSVMFVLKTGDHSNRIALRHTTLALMVMASKQLCPGEWQAIDLLDASGHGLKL